MPTKRIIKKEKVQEVSGLGGYMSATGKKIIKRYQQNEHQKAWWLEEPEKVWSSVEAAVSVLETAQITRRMLNIKFSRLYSNMEAIGFPYSNLMKGSQDNTSNNRISFNVIQSVIDAVAAKIAKDQPKVTFVTTGADDYFLKLRAENLTKYTSGLFKQAGVYDNAELVFRDACVVGTGFLHILEREGEIKTEWCASDEIRVDELDGMKQKPRSIHRVTLVPRDRLMLDYPEHEDKILSAVSALQGKIAVASTTEMVRVIESWHIRGNKKANDGVHCITIENCTLFYEEYNKDYFPIVAFRWMNRPLGYFGRSITEEIMTIQVEINKILRTIQQCQELAAVPIIFVPNEAEIAEDVLLSNAIARMVPYSGGNPPTWFPGVSCPAEVYSHLNSLIQWAFQVVGLSQTSASGMKPAGVDSAVAIREVADIETGRFAMVANRWEDFFVQCAKITTDMSKDLYTKDNNLKVDYAESKILKEIKWKDVDLKDKPFDIQTFPTSQLPDTPAGRIQTITEYIQNQWISKERGMELLNLDPDLEQEVNIQTASLRLTEKWLSEMVEEGVYHKPEPLMNLQLAQQVAQGIYTMLVHDGCPEDRLQLVRQFIMECVDMLNPPQPPAPPPQQGPQPGQAPPPGSQLAPLQAPPQAPQPPPLSQT
jgi:hypothetical protein